MSENSARDYYSFINTDPARDSRERALKEDISRAGLDTARQTQRRTEGLITDEATNRRRQAEAEASDKRMADDEGALAEGQIGAPGPTTMIPGHMGTVDEANALQAESRAASQGGPGGGAPAPKGAMAGPSAPGAIPATLKMSPATLIRRAKEFRARGDHKAADALLSQATQANEVEQDNASIAQAREMVTDPKKMQAVLAMLNKDPAITLSSDGKNRFAITTQNSQGVSSLPAHISQADMIQLMHGTNMLSTNPTKGLAIISGINKALGAHLKELNEQQLKAQAGNTADQTSDAHMITANAAATRAGLDRKAAALANRTVDPKIAAQLEELRTQLDDLPDGDPQRKPLMQSYNRLYGQAALSMGKTVAPREPKGPEPMKANPDGTYSQNGRLYREDPDNPGKLLEITPPGPSLAERIAAAREKNAGGAPAAQPGLPRTPPPAPPPRAPSTGVEGLSPQALARVAADPTNPSAPAARAALEQLKRDRAGLMRERMSDPATDPSLYQ